MLCNYSFCYQISLESVYMHIVPIPVSPFYANCYAVACSETNEAIIIDAGDEPDKILALVQQKGWILKFLINTHAHVDHISAVAAIQAHTKVPFYLHEKEKPVLDFLITSQKTYGFGDGQIPTVDHYLDPAQTYRFGTQEIQIVETPGHTPGGTCLLIENHLFSGDTLFAGSIGRTDLPGGSTSTLLQSIKEKLMVLDEKTIVHCGHGPNTTIGKEKKENPFLQGSII